MESLSYGKLTIEGKTFEQLTPLTEWVYKLGYGVDDDLYYGFLMLKVQFWDQMEKWIGE